MEIWEAVLLGLVEGLTEYLPVSSTGHLLLTQRLLGLPQDHANDAFAICVQGGAVLAVLGLYWRRFRSILLGLAGRDREGLVLFGHLVVAFVPAAVVGLLFDAMIEEALFGGGAMGLWPIAGAWVAGGVVIFAESAHRAKRADEGGLEVTGITWRIALVVGLAQCAALWPGVSRSLATIIGGLMAGMRLSAAVEFSFLLGVMTLGAATAYKGLQHGEAMVTAFGWPILAAGFAVATVSAFASAKWMVAYLQRHDTRVFGVYRIVLGLVTALLVLRGLV